MSAAIPAAVPEPLRTARARYPARAMEVDGCAWRVRDTGGTGAPLLLLPGSLGNADIFFRQLLALPPRLRCLAVDYPEAPAAALAEGLAGLMDHLGLRSAALLGSSLAGYWLQDLAARHPGRVAALVLANTFRDATTLRRHPLFRPDMLHRVSGEALKAEWLARLLAREPDELRDVQLALLGEGQNGEALRQRLLAAATATPTLPVPQGQFPIGVIDCADDPILDPATRDALAASCPAAKRLTLPAGGHYPHVTQAGSYNSFVDDVVAAG